jgi:hypothetical protein
VLTGVTLLAPLALATQEIAEQIIQWITSLCETGIPVPTWVAQLPIAGGQIEGWLAGLDLGSAMEGQRTGARGHDSSSYQRF